MSVKENILKKFNEEFVSGMFDLQLISESDKLLNYVIVLKNRDTILVNFVVKTYKKEEEEKSFISDATLGVGSSLLCNEFILRRWLNFLEKIM